MKKKILVVDNDPLILGFIAGLLEQEGHEVVTAEDGISALDRLASFTPEIMFIDLIMPRIDGEKLCRIVRNMPHLDNCYLVILSAAIIEQENDCSRINANTYIAKGSFSTMSEHILAIVHDPDPFRRDSKPSRIIGHDGSSGRQMTKELLSQNRHLEIVLNSMSEGILEVYSGKIVYANSAAVTLSGLSEEELLGSYPPDLFEQREGQRLEALLKSGIDKSPEIDMDNPLKFNGSLVCIKTYPLQGKSSIIILMNDVSEKKQAEKEKRELEARLQRAQKMETIGTLAGGVAHDLNNVLSGLVSYPDLILMDLPKDSHLRKPLLTIQQSGEKAAAIVQELLTLTRRGVSVTEIVNLNDIIAEYLISPEYEKLKSFHPHVEVETHLVSDLLNIMGSPVHLFKTVMNLLSNPAEAMPAGGTISISTKNRYVDRPIKGYDHVKEGDYVLLIVSDTGEGISSKDMERIFEPFYTKKVMGRSGTGLGMTVVWGTVKDHKGYIDVESTEGKGTTFTLYFPATRKELSKEKEKLSFEEYESTGESILIVDDVEEQREIASGILKKLGYSVRSVSSGEEAVEYMKSNSVDLLILDMIMEPGINGLDTYRQILKLRAGQKAIITSGFSETDSIKEAQRLGAGTYIKKPYTLERIGVTVKEALT